MAAEPENLVLAPLRAMRADMATKADVKELKAELRPQIHSLRADVASDMLRMQKDARDQIVGLRRAVIELHASLGAH